ncbi:VOC family protein [Kitasatospora fiedleri]|uniref:VOC family protein n=1 Tax=Kitasatospora fiedleri TaxID=2991545 RepID=UPI002499E9DE|nr:VOC family protein [Kitasatospora fiedleri]
MACRIGELVLDCADPERLAAFWGAVLGYVELGREPDGSIELGPPADGYGGPLPALVLSPTTDPRPVRLPLHLDLSPLGPDPATETDPDTATETARLLALGARRLGTTTDRLVLADPEGNEFCLRRPRTASS